jgi:hypothetical protein
MHVQCRFDVGVHGDTTLAANLRERQDVSQRVGVIPYSAEIAYVADERGKLGAAVGEYLRGVGLVRMLVRKCGLRNTETVDWLSRSTQVLGMRMLVLAKVNAYSDGSAGGAT